MLPRVDTKSATAVMAFVQGTYASLYAAGANAWLERLFREIEALFKGDYPGYAPVDLRYHDFEHTLQATVCLTELFAGCCRTGNGTAISARQFELGIAAVMLHDAGYVKLRSDFSGTGAKYTFCHVLRSCAFAASYLPHLGATESEINGVLSAINCTGPTKEIGRLQFRDRGERLVGSALGTADFLGQMAAPDYPDELGCLFEEFAESDAFVGVPPEERLFRSAEDLIGRTPEFWRKSVRPKLEHEFEATYRFLDSPDGRNAYVEAVEANIARIEKSAMRSAAPPA